MLLSPKVCFYFTKIAEHVFYIQSDSHFLFKMLTLGQPQRKVLRATN